MITPSKAARLVLKYTGYEQVVCVKRYDFFHFVVEALPQSGKIPGHGTCTTYAVNLITGKIAPIHLKPFSTLEKYQSSKNCKF